MGVVLRGRPLAAGGEMGARMRAIDWSRTPLGPVASWPQSLRTWGASCELATRCSSGGAGAAQHLQRRLPPDARRKHPAALGRPRARSGRRSGTRSGPMARGASSAARRPTRTSRSSSSATATSRRRTSPSRTARADDERRRRRHVLHRAPRRPRRCSASAARACCATSRARAPRRRAPTTRPARIAAAGARRQRARPALRAPLPARQGGGRAPGGAQADGHAGAPAAPTRDRLATRAGAVAARRGARAASPNVLIDVAARFGRSPAAPGRAARRARGAAPPAAGRRPAGVLVAGRQPAPRARRRLPRLLELLAGQRPAPHRERARLRGGAPARRGAAELDRAKTAFFSNVSHEFRTPLTLMLGPLEDVLRDATACCRRAPRSSSRSAHRNSLRLLKLVNTLLDFSRIEAGRAQARYEPTDLAALTRRPARARSARPRARRASRSRRLPAAPRAACTSIATCGRRSS